MWEWLVKATPRPLYPPRNDPVKGKGKGHPSRGHEGPEGE